MVEGAFSCSEEPSGDSHTPPICCKQLDLAAGGVWGLALPAQGLPGSGLGGSACCILHVWGCLWGTPWGMSPARCRGSCCDLPCSKLDSVWGGDMPTCQGHAMCLAGLGNAPYLHSQSVTWGGGGHSPAWRQSPPTLYPQAAGPGQLCVPIPTCLGTCCCSQGGSFGTPNSSGWCLYPHGLQSLAGGVAGTSAPLCGPGEDRSLWPDPGLPQPTDTPPLLLPAVFHHRGCQGQGWLSPLCCTPPMAVSHPEFGYMSLGGGAASVVPPPTPALMPWWGGYSFWWVLQIMVLSTLDSLLF